MSLEVIESEKLLSIFYTMTLRQIDGALPVTAADNFESRESPNKSRICENRPTT